MNARMIVAVCLLACFCASTALAIHFQHALLMGAMCVAFIACKVLLLLPPPAPEVSLSSLDELVQELHALEFRMALLSLVVRLEEPSLRRWDGVRPLCEYAIQRREDLCRQIARLSSHPYRSPAA